MNAIRFYNDPSRTNLIDEMLQMLASDNVREKCACGCVAANIIETDDHFRIDLSVPGFQREEIRISLDKNVLTVRSEKKNEEEDVRYIRREYETADFERRFILPKHVDSDRITASSENGILGIVIPKKDEIVEKVSKEISIL